MDHIRKIAIIGATGRLGLPVTLELAKGFQVRALVRTPIKAHELLPSGIEIVKADLRDVDTLRAGLRGVDAVYLNLATETERTDLPFYEEREGIANLLTAMSDVNIRYIAKISALGAYPPAAKAISDNAVPNIIRSEGHDLIIKSGIAHTFFAPTHFMELLPFMIQGNALQWIGNTDIPIYWISVVDYARMVVKAFKDPSRIPTDVPVQGPEAITVRQAMETFRQNYDPKLTIRIVPVWVMRLVGLFDPKMRFVAHLFAYFANHTDPFYAQDTWDVFGKPTTTLVEFAKRLHEKDAVKLAADEASMH